MFVEDDVELLQRWRCGDPRGGSDLLKRHLEALQRFFAPKVSGHVEDLVQQTFVRCVEARDAFRGDGSFRAFLLGLARHTLYDHYRKHYRTDIFDFATTCAMDLHPSPTVSHCVDEEKSMALALQSVPLDQRIALELAYWEGLTAPEIAGVLGVSENTVYSRIRRAKEHLRTALIGLSDSDIGA